MNPTLLLSFTLTLLYCQVYGAVSDLLPIRSVSVRVKVVDPDGVPVEGATVYLSLPRYEEGGQDVAVQSLTDLHGMAEVSGPARQDYTVGVGKQGYYFTSGPQRSLTTEKGIRSFASAEQQLVLELKPVRNPTASRVRYEQRLQIPPGDRPIGYDLEIGDWVQPYGRGKEADFQFLGTGEAKSDQHYAYSLTLNFSREGDGIIRVNFPLRRGSQFPFPYAAPKTGYQPTLTWTKSREGAQFRHDNDLTGETHYLFRVRSELEPDGSVRRALYGVVRGDFNFFWTKGEGTQVTFRYALNADGSDNLEFAPDQAQAIGRMPP
ncbi:MAG: hypothetical protein JNG83_05160 [Opitutaceae bacterium]|nr:hypothetical protein [Opitutaceae bacterium]